MKKIFTISLLIVGLVFLIIVVTNYNKFPNLDENVNEKLSQVQNQYKRRADLIPNLVETVKAYAVHEKSTFIEVTEARNKVSQINLDEKTLTNPEFLQQFEAAQANLSSALSKLMVVVEKYPDLKANENFLSLQSQLEGSENRIAVARRDLIEAIKQYNIALRTIPSKFVAMIFYPEMEVKENFKATEAEQTVPKVKF